MPRTVAAAIISVKLERGGGLSNSTETFQIPLEAAEAYEERFVPALFAEWAPVLVEFVSVTGGQSVLDVACGTGIVARAAAARLGSHGRVVGADLNESMLTVARRVAPSIEFKQADAGALPFSDGEFDAVLCQMALMFFPDRVQALREMGRVAKDVGTIAIVVPASLQAQPAWGPFVEIVARHAGDEAISLLGTYWNCGDLGELRSWFASAGLDVTSTQTRMGTAKFPSVDALVTTEVQSTPLGERLTDDEFERILAETRDAVDEDVPTVVELR